MATVIDWARTKQQAVESSTETSESFVEGGTATHLQGTDLLHLSGASCLRASFHENLWAEYLARPLSLPSFVVSGPTTVLKYHLSPFQWRDTLSGICHRYWRIPYDEPFGFMLSTERTTSRAYSSSLMAALFKLFAFREFDADWDSYGARQITPRAMLTAFRVLLSVARQLDPLFGDRAIPYVVAPVPTGGIQFEWNEAHGDLELEIGPDADLRYLLVRHRDGNPDYDEGVLDAESDVLSLISRYLGLTLSGWQGVGTHLGQ